MINLVIGDVHVTPNELDDCEALFGLIEETIKEEQPSQITFMGDLYHNHSIVDVRCIEFWKRWLDRLGKIGGLDKKYFLLVGNHDQVSPTYGYPHALLSHYRDFHIVVDKPVVGNDGLAYLPYYHDPKEFIVKAQGLAASDPKVHTLFCHQTIIGAKFETGFYVKDAVDIGALPFKHIISGHIHTPQTVGNKVLYVGSPRWRILSDAGANRYLWIFECTEERTELKKKIPTGTVCRRIYRYIDSEKERAIIAVPEALRHLADIRVDVYGSSDYIAKRTIELKAICGAKCRGFPERTKLSQVSDIEGIPIAFDRFSSKFESPNKTPLELLRTTVQERLMATALS